MKHILPLIAAVALLASCAIQQQKNTVRLSEIETSIVAPVVADLDISDVRLSFTYYPSKAELGTPAKFRGILAKDGADSIHEERQIRYAPQLSTEAFEFGVE